MFSILKSFFFYGVLALLASVTFAGLAKPQAKALRQEDSKVTDRVRCVRQMYERILPPILDMSEPVDIVKGAAYEDGGTVVLHIKDAHNKTVVFHLDRKLDSPTRGTLFVHSLNQVKKAVVLRGAEEAALYGLLLRAKLPVTIDEGTAIGVKVMLGNLDDRFAEEGAKILQSERVAKMFEDMRAGKYKKEGFPKLDWTDVPSLLDLADSRTMLKTHPVNPLSSMLMVPCAEGLIALWLVEGMRAGDRFPSLNPPSSNSETQKALADAYRAWWERVKTLPRERASSIHPLSGTALKLR